MENKKIYNDDVERIVNDPERRKAIDEFHKKRKFKKHRQTLIDAIVYAVLSISFGLMGCFGCMIPWVAFPVFATCGLYSAFCLGRWWRS